MNDKKKETMLEDISEHIADHDMRNHHYLTDSEIIDHFKTVYKKKHVKEILSEIR